MSFEHAIDIFASRNGDEVRGLLNLDTIVIIDETHVGKIRFVLSREHEVLANDIIDSFGSSFIRAGKSKIVNLAEEDGCVPLFC